MQHGQGEKNTNLDPLYAKYTTQLESSFHHQGILMLNIFSVNIEIV